jgi:glycosyltransferase involved in cell wall biosynthesis
MTLSIITINYNNREGLQKTIDSVICQTWKDYEWIIIDGGSTDGSRRLIEQYQQYFAFWCSEPDQGVYHAMNKGVAKAKGVYVYFLNSGDTYSDAYVLKMISDLHSCADIISGQAISKDDHVLLYQFNGSLFEHLYVSTISHQGAFIRRSLLNKYPYDESLKIVSDWKFWLQTIIWDNAKVEIADIVVAEQDMTGISTDQNPNKKSKGIEEEERGKVLNELFPPLLRNELDESRNRLAELDRIRKKTFVVYGDYLQNNNHLLFAVGWRILKLFTVIHKTIRQIK